LRPRDTLYYMELTTAMLADGAHVAGGKLYILGGQWDRLTAATFPTQHPSMALALVIKVEYDEAPQTYPLDIELTLDGRAVESTKVAGTIAIGHAPGQVHGAPQFAPMAIPFNNVTFSAAGRYEWVITVGNDELGRVPIEVAQGVIPGAPAGAKPEAD
jgi:hypothetical protein